MKRLGLIAGCLLVGTFIGAYFFNTENLAGKLRALVGLSSNAEHAHAVDEGADHEKEHASGKHEHGEHAPGHNHDAKPSTAASADTPSENGHDDGKLIMSAEQIERSKITVEPAEAGILRKRLRVPGTIIPDRNRVGRVPSKVVGTVAELKKGLGDLVNAGEVIAILDSREVADAKSEYIAAIVNFELQETLYQRDKVLWEKKVSSEQRLLRSEATYREAQVRRDLAKQKLSALGVSDDAIAKLAKAGHGATGLERYDIKAPISGRIVDQLVDVGTPMGGEGQAHELYAIADLSKVWAELTVSPQDLPLIKEGQHLTVDSAENADGTIIFTSPVLNQDTRSARVIASLDNMDGTWRPGSYITANIAISETKADLVIPKTALQTIERATSVFVRTEDGFESRQVIIGDGDDNFIQVLSGLKPGEPIAVTNTFLLKAELGKSEAAHDH